MTLLLLASHQLARPRKPRIIGGTEAVKRGSGIRARGIGNTAAQGADGAGIFIVEKLLSVTAANRLGRESDSVTVQLLQLPPVESFPVKSDEGKGGA